MREGDDGATHPGLTRTRIRRRDALAPTTHEPPAWRARLRPNEPSAVSHRVHPRRVLFIVIPSVILGCLVTVGVAWTCARWGGVDARPTIMIESGDDEVWTVQMAQGFGLRRVSATRRAPTSLLLPTFPMEGEPPGPTELPEFDFEGKNELGSIEIVEAGWPFRALRAERRLALAAFDPRDEPWGGSIVLSPGSVFLPFSARVLPTVPLWPGLLGNVAITSAAFALAFTLPSAWRRRRRIARSRCPACNYDLRGTPGTRCPECGEAVPAARSVPTAPSPPAAARDG